LEVATNGFEREQDLLTVSSFSKPPDQLLTSTTSANLHESLQATPQQVTKEYDPVDLSITQVLKVSPL
jgi:hypothetical protein